MPPISRPVLSQRLKPSLLLPRSRSRGFRGRSSSFRPRRRSREVTALPLRLAPLRDHQPGLKKRGGEPPPAHAVECVGRDWKCCLAEACISAAEIVPSAPRCSAPTKALEEVEPVDQGEASAQTDRSQARHHTAGGAKPLPPTRENRTSMPQRRF